MIESFFLIVGHGKIRVMELLKHLNPEQKKAVTYDEGPLLIVAGAGTGKTMVITQRIAWLISQGKAKSDEILAVTFTDKASGEMEERVDKLLPLGYLDLWVSTFHGFCQRVLQDYALDIGLPRDFKLLDQTSQWLLIRQNLSKFDLDYYKPLGNPTKFIHALLGHFSRAKDEAIDPEEYLKYVESLKLNLNKVEESIGKPKKHNKNYEELSGDRDEISRLEEVAKAYSVYQQIMLDNNSLDFGDLINYTLKLFQKRPKILEKYTQQFKYILVDEFQDTNWSQYELIKLLSRPKNNLTVVADDDQSIYKFRGASVSNVTQFYKDYPETEVISITTNYRSYQRILDESHKFIELNNPNRLEAQSLNGKKIDKKLKAYNEGKAGYEYLFFDNQHGEAVGTIQKILELKGDTEDVTWNDFAILVRANSLADPFVTTLESAGIPYQHLASRGLYTKSIILDIVNFLKLLDDYHESPSLWRVLNWPVFNFKTQTLVGINHHARKKAHSLYQAIYWWHQQPKIDKIERDELRRVIDLIEKHTKMSQEKRPREVILSFLEESGYLKWLVNKQDTQTAQQLSFLEQFDDRLKKFETEAYDPSIKNFMTEMRMELESGETGSLQFDLDAGPEAVKIMTIHAAKGLEFKNVFIVGLVDKRFPAINRRDPIELPNDLVKETIPEGDIHIQEERRLMYVAMTRAKENLYFTSAKNYGGKSDKKLSRFLYELNLADKGIYLGEKVKGVFKDTETSRQVTQEQEYGYKLPTRYSFTQMKNFENCPYQYRFSNLVRVPTRANHTLSFGKTMHETLRKFFDMVNERRCEQEDLFGDPKKKEDSDIPSLKELNNIYQEEWLDDWYESHEDKEKYREKGKKILKDFHAKVIDSPPRVKYLEQGFNLKIQDPDNKQVYSFFGVIDRIDALNKDEIEIIDYKTGVVKTEKTIEKDQLLIYQIAAKEVLNMKPKKLTFYYLNDNKPVSFFGKDEETVKMKERMVNFVRQLKESNFRPTPSSHKCKYCDYRNICEYRAL